ncbi:MAG: hypothetical protein Q8928_00235 [Bacteroidota bacterium]|nr:hypothetical protein [Bacteroidota bacterium]
MKSIVILLVIFNLLTSCKKNNDDPNNYSKYPASDTTYYITYQILDQTYKYYQILNSHEGIGGTLNDTASYYGFPFYFEEFHEAGQEAEERIELSFWRVAYNNSYMPPSMFIKSSMRYTYPVFIWIYRTRSISDTIFSNGVSLKTKFPYINNLPGSAYTDYSTCNLIDLYDYDTIYNNILKDSYFKILNMKPVGNKFLVEGEFKTVLSGTQNSKWDLLYLRNGHFKILMD